MAKYADACNFYSGPDETAHKVDVLRRHCDAVGRDPNEIEVTTSLRDLPAGASADDVLRRAEAYAAVGVSTLIAQSEGSEPAASLEATFGPVVERFHEIEPARL